MTFKSALLLITFLFVLSHKSNAQWQNSNRLYDLNNWSYQPGFFEWYETSANAPASSSYGNGIQLVLGTDTRFGAQLAIPTFDPNLYFRRNGGGTWDSWAKVWSSANLNSLNFDLNAKNLNSNGVIKLINVDNQAADWDNIQLRATGVRSYIESNGDENGLFIKSNTGNKILLMSDVGIGTETPKEKLSVNGKIRAHEIKVETANWPDYVFEDGYRVGTLEALESYIKVHKHLPEIPSAKEAEANGVALGDMNKLLLKKIEELTLHLIEKDKEVNKLIQINDSFKERLNKIENHLKL